MPRLDLSVFVCVLLPTLAACGGSSDAGSGGLSKGNYADTRFAEAVEFGELKAFNVHGQAVSVSPTHGLIIIDVNTSVFTSLGTSANYLGFDDDGDLLYSVNGPRFLRYGDGTVEPLPATTTSNGDFTPFALAPGGAVWGYTFEKHEGQAGIPGFAVMKHGVVSQFRAWGDRAPETGTTYITRGANSAGQIVFCKAQNGADIGGNGLPKEECFIAQPDGSATDLNPIYKNAFRVDPLPINERGELAGIVDYGIGGLGGSRVFLYSPPTGYLLGEESGSVLALNDLGDVIYSQLVTPLTVTLRKANGDKFDLGSYIQNPYYPSREHNYQDILGMNAAGQILVRQAYNTSGGQNVVLLTPR